MISPDTRRSIERRIVRRILIEAVRSDCVISVWDGEDWSIRRSNNPTAILAAMFATDEETLVIRRASGPRIGSVFLVYGNDGPDVICNHTDSDDMNALLAPAYDLADQLDNLYS